MRAIVIAVVLLCIPASAQEAHEQDRCWFASESFTPGATIRAGETVMACQTDFTWATTTQNAAGCLLDGDVSSYGAIVEAGPADSNVKSQCQLDGTWLRLD